MRLHLLLAFALLAQARPGAASETDAVAIARTIVERHLPHGTILDPIFAAPDSDQIAGYTRCGDSAIWTGHFLAAESYRWAVTRSPEALDNVKRALAGMKLLVDVTGTDLLSRCAVPVDSPFAPGITQEEQSHGVAIGTVSLQQYFWVGDTSRDQYIGAFFGLTVANDVVDAPEVKAAVGDLVTRMLSRLLHDRWLVRMPGGEVSTAFLGRVDQQLALLKIGQRVDDDRFGDVYRGLAWTAGAAVVVPVSWETLDPNGSYFKFNLDSECLFALTRYESNWWLKKPYGKAYDILRRTTDDHGNAHFNMIDRAIRGADRRRDAETRQLLEEWLERPRRDVGVDLNGAVDACGDNIACRPIPVPLRVTTDFLWQRSPFQMVSGGDGLIEGSGIDYILPYWMARYYGVL